MAEEIINRVALSPLITLDLADYHTPGDRVLLDIKDQLFMEAILREKDFRAYVKENDWSQFEGKHVAITCSADAIVPVWAYMLLATVLEPVAKNVVFGNLDTLEYELFRQELHKLNPEDFSGKKVVIKGCGDIHVPESVYVEITRILRPQADKLMYGEPCSTVPIYKKPKVRK